MPDRRARPTRGGRRDRRAARPAPAWPAGPVPITTGTAEVVVEPARPTQVTLLVNGVPSSHLDLEDPRWLEFEYMQQMAAVVDLLPPGPLAALHLGAGACALPRWLDATRPGSRQLAVDVDDRLVTLVREWFDLPRSPALRLRADDAGRALAGTRPGSWDVVVRDVFRGATTPYRLTSDGFARAARRALRPDGVLLLNCAGTPPLTDVRGEAATLAAVFEQVVLLAEPGVLKGRRRGNVVLAAGGPAAPPLDGAELERRVRALAVPVRLLHGAALTAFVGGTPRRPDRPDRPDATTGEAAPPDGDAASES